MRLGKSSAMSLLRIHGHIRRSVRQPSNVYALLAKSCDQRLDTSFKSLLGAFTQAGKLMRTAYPSPENFVFYFWGALEESTSWSHRDTPVTPISVAGMQSIDRQPREDVILTTRTWNNETPVDVEGQQGMGPRPEPNVIPTPWNEETPGEPSRGPSGTTRTVNPDTGPNNDLFKSLHAQASTIRLSRGQRQVLEIMKSARGCP